MIARCKHPLTTDIVLSVQPRHSQNIIAGLKSAELRTRLLPIRYDERPVRAFMYETKPTGKIVAEFAVFTADPVHRDMFDPSEILSALNITAAEFRSYLSKSSIGWSHPIEDLIVYDQPYDLEDFGLQRAPQSWQYVYTIPEELFTGSGANPWAVV